MVRLKKYEYRKIKIFTTLFTPNFDVEIDCGQVLNVHIFSHLQLSFILSSCSLIHDIPYRIYIETEICMEHQEHKKAVMFREKNQFLLRSLSCLSSTLKNWRTYKFGNEKSLLTQNVIKNKIENSQSRK